MNKPRLCHCGGLPDLRMKHTLNGDTYRVSCLRDSCPADTGWADSEAKVIGTWNRICAKPIVYSCTVQQID